MVSFETQQKVLHGDFDIDIHKDTFVNYLEVIIDEDGIVHYAVPSHQEYLISIISKKYNTDREGVMNMVPPEYYFDVLEWMCKETGCIVCWSDGYKFFGTMTDKQQDTVNLLCRENLLKNRLI